MILEFLELHSISYERADHEPVYTCEQASATVPYLNGADTKNLFVRNDKKEKYFLLAVPPAKKVDLKKLSAELQVRGLSLASGGELKSILGIEPGAVSLLAVLNDRARKVTVLIDEELWRSEALLCHPLVNTSTLALRKEMLEKFFSLTGHSPLIIRIAERG